MKPRLGMINSGPLQWWEYGRYLPRRPRWLNWAWTRIARLFWMPCPRCGETFGGHERGPRTYAYQGEDGYTFKMICYRHSSETSCPHDPRVYAGLPIGMYHCPECGAMVLAGLAHPCDDDVAEQGVDPYDEVVMRAMSEVERAHNIARGGTCPVCGGNDRDMPCAYPSGGQPGCLRDQRLQR